MNQIIPLIRTNDNYINVIDKSAKHYDIFIDENISSPGDYREFLSILFNAAEDDSINIFFNCNGGDLDTALSIVEGLKNTQAFTTGIILGACHSAASIMVLYCNNIIVTDNAYMLVHTASFGSSGNTGNVKAHTEFTIKQVEKLLDVTYEGFLSKEELGNVKKGVDLWLTAEEITNRVQKRHKVIKSKHAKLKKQSNQCNSSEDN